MAIWYRLCGLIIWSNQSICHAFCLIYTTLGVMLLPFSRFEKLAKEKRELLLDQAARELAAYGFEQSSLNRILEQSNMSKGAAYYYFEDKADLFVTVIIQYASEHLCLPELEMDINSLTNEDFWDKLESAAAR